MIRAVLFDCFGVLVGHDGVDPALGEVVMALKGRVKLGVLSNLAANEIPRLIGLEMAAHFEQIMVSGEIGVAKPDMRAYLIAAQRLREFPEQCLLIDDNEANCTAARAVGMQTVHYKNSDDLWRCLVEYGIITP